MSLVYCPECGHEISANAVACPNCGRPIAPAPAVEKRVVVAPPVRRDSFPTWAFIPIGVLGLLLLFLIYFAFLRNPDDMANTNVSVRANTRAISEPTRDIQTTTIPSTSGQSVTLPPNQTTSIPSTSTSSTTIPGTTTAPPVAPPPDKGTATISAKIQGLARGSSGLTVAVVPTDKDVEQILNEARVEPIEGNDVMASLGLAIVFPDRYGDFLRNAMRAVAAHSKYAGTTDGGGNANLKAITPNEYYLFGITKVGHGFALWNAPVSIIAGQNNLNLSPQSVTEIPDANG